MEKDPLASLMCQRTDNFNYLIQTSCKNLDYIEMVISVSHYKYNQNSHIASWQGKTWDFDCTKTKQNKQPQKHNWKSVGAWLVVVVNARAPFVTKMVAMTSLSWKLSVPQLSYLSTLDDVQSILLPGKFYWKIHKENTQHYKWRREYFRRCSQRTT